MANKVMPGDYETTVGNESPELSLILSKQVRGIPLTDAENAAMGNPVNIRPRPRPPEVIEAAKKARKRKGVTPEDQSELNNLLRATTPSYKNGGMVDRAAIRGKTKGKIC